MDARLQRRVQRYGWDRAASFYEAGWHAQLAPAQDVMLAMTGPARGERVIDVACGTGLVTFRLAAAVTPSGGVLGTDLSGEMVRVARCRAAELGLGQVRIERADAEELPAVDATFDAAVCALGLMYVPDPMRAVAEMRRVVRPGGRVAAAVWGARQACGWAEVFPIVDARVASDVCPMFFHLGTGDTLSRTMAAAGLVDIHSERLSATLVYRSGAEALHAAFEAGPVALAYGRFDAATREEAHAAYLRSIAAHRDGDGYRIPGEFVVVAARRPPSDGH